MYVTRPVTAKCILWDGNNQKAIEDALKRLFPDRDWFIADTARGELALRYSITGTTTIISLDRVPVGGWVVVSMFGIHTVSNEVFNSL